jgi:hypothetical protein
MPSNRRPVSDESAAPKRNWKKVSADPAAGRDVSTASAPANNRTWCGPCNSQSTNDFHRNYPLALWTPTSSAVSTASAVTSLLTNTGQQGRKGTQTGGGGGGSGGGGGPEAIGPGGSGGGPHGSALATPAPRPAAATAIPPHNAVAPKNRRSLTVRCAIIISPHRRNNIDASCARLSRPVQRLGPSYAIQLDGLRAPNSVAAQSLSKMLLTMSSPIPMPAPVTIAWPNRPPRNRCSVPPPDCAGCWYWA